MPDLSTTYLGIPLKNPIIVGSSPLTATTEKVKQCEQAGVGAVVLKSLFEEQIDSDASAMIQGIDTGIHTDAYDFLQGKSREYYANRYLEFIEDAKKAVNIPLIASLNCVGAGSWTSYARQLEAVGADAIELNVFIIPANAKRDGREIEKEYLRILEQVKSQVNIPVSMKLGSHFSGLAGMIHRLCDAGAAGLVLFNRFYRPDVDIERLKLKPAGVLSTPEEIGLSLQWIALMSGEVSCDLAASTGIWDGKAIIKQLLSGAKAVQICSAFMKNGLSLTEQMLKELTDWMERKNYGKISDFSGVLCQERSSNPEAYERSQYIRAVTGIE